MFAHLHVTRRDAGDDGDVFSDDFGSSSPNPATDHLLRRQDPNLLTLKTESVKIRVNWMPAAPIFVESILG